MQRDKTFYNITCRERYQGTYNNKVEYRKLCVHPKNVPNKWRKMFIHDKTKTNSFKVKLYNDNKQKPKEITKDGWYFPQRTSFHIWQIICCCFKSKLKKWIKIITQNVLSIVLKPGPARWVDPGPGRPGSGAGPGLSKKQQWDPVDPVGRPGTRPTRVNPAETRPYYIYIHEQNDVVFS